MNHKWYRLFLLCPFLLTSGCAAAQTAPAKEESEAIQVLFIGNSYVFFNSLPQTFVRLVESAGNRVHAEMVAKGGWTLGQHVASEQTMSKIASREWDYVILQEQSVMPSIPTEREKLMYPAARALNKAISDQGARTVFMMTWGRRDGLREAGFTDFGAMQEQLATGYTAYLLPTSWVCSLTRYQVAAMSCRRSQPRQRVVTPGSPSDLRPRKPPSCAIQRTA